MAVLEKKWYVIRAVSGQEVKVKNYIELEIGRLGHGDYVEQVLVPMEKVSQMRGTKKVSVDRVFFPGYVMIKADLSGEVLHVIKGISGVIGFLGETRGGNPVALRKHEINRMFGVVDELEDKKEMVSIPYELGQQVKITDGAFEGFVGEVQAIHQEKRKLEVVVKMFGRKTPVELNYTQVEKIV